MSSRFWMGVERRFVPPLGPVLLEDAGAAARIPVYNGLLSSLNALVLTIVFFAFAEPTTGWMTIALVAAYAGASTYYLVTGHTQVYIHLMVWSSLVHNLAVHIELGGFVWSGASITWGVIVSTSAALLFARRTALTVVGTYVTAAAILLFLEPWLRGRRTAPDPALSALLAADVFVVSLLIVVPIILLLLSQVATERQRAEDLIRNVLPGPIADRLKRAPGVIADEFDDCTVLFADLVGFTAHARGITPEELVTQLDEVFSSFDAMVARAGAEKVKTMGDGYMVVAGAPTRRPDDASVICGLALEMRDEMPRLNAVLGTDLGLRVGVARGRLVGGVIGRSRVSYDLWGDTVNQASRMEGLAEPGTIRVTGAVAVAAGAGYQFTDGGDCEVKGIGTMPTFVLVGEKSLASSG